MTLDELRMIGVALCGAAALYILWRGFWSKDAPWRRLDRD